MPPPPPRYGQRRHRRGTARPPPNPLACPPPSPGVAYLAPPLAPRVFPIPVDWTACCLATGAPTAPPCLVQLGPRPLIALARANLAMRGAGDLELALASRCSRIGTVTRCRRRPITRSVPKSYSSVATNVNAPRPRQRPGGRPVDVVWEPSAPSKFTTCPSVRRRCPRRDCRWRRALVFRS